MDPIKTNTIHNGDSAEVLKTFPDECVDLTVTSPPYGEARNYHGDSLFDFETIARELARVTKPGGVIVWNVACQTRNGSESGDSFRQALYFMDVCGLRLHDTMIYLKNSASYPAGRDGVRYSDVFEYVFVFSKGKPKTHNLLCDKFNNWAGTDNFGTPSNILVDGTFKRREKKVIPDCSPRNNVQPYNKGHKYTTRVKARNADDAKAIQELLRKHPAKMPDLLAFDQIRTWTSGPDDVVLDVFSGSGTSCVMAKVLNRQYIGIEKSQKYCDVIHERLTLEYDVEELSRQSTKEYNSYHRPRVVKGNGEGRHE